VEEVIECIGDNVQIRPKVGVWMTEIGQGVQSSLQESGEVLLQALHEGELAGFFFQLAEDIADGLSVTGVFMGQKKMGPRFLH